MVNAQGSLALSISPTLVELGASPGDSWRSNLKVINTNDFDLTVYGSPVNFIPRGEGGQGDFVPVPESEQFGSTLAEWVTLEQASITIPAGSSAQLPFIVSVPEDAAPGGHFAAILVSTQPPVFEGESASLRTTQVVSSLFFLRVAGDVIESGSIRSFTAENTYSANPETSIELRFENTGNVHLRPQGDIVISNMWGRERGRIPVNYNTSFGNSLPNSIRKYEFAWSKDFSISDIGRYKAEIALAYGSENRQFATRTAAFWVIPTKGLFITFTFIVFFFAFIIWVVRMYIRRMFAIAGFDPEIHGAAIQKKSLSTRTAMDTSSLELDIRTPRVSDPVTVGIIDLKQHLARAPQLGQKIYEVFLFGIEYKKLLLSILVTIGLVILIVLFVGGAISDETAYNVTVGSEAASTEYNAEEIAFLRLAGRPVDGNADSSYQVSVINTSGKAGTAGEIAHMLVEGGLAVSVVDVEIGRTEDRTIVLFSPELQAEALRISELLGGALLSAQVETEAQITVYVGVDQKK